MQAYVAFVSPFLLKAPDWSNKKAEIAIARPRKDRLDWQTK